MTGHTVGEGLIGPSALIAGARDAARYVPALQVSGIDSAHLEGWLIARSFT